MLYSDSLRDAQTSYSNHRDANDDDDEPEEGEELDDTAARSKTASQPVPKGNYAGKKQTYNPLQLNVKGAASAAPSATPVDAPPAYDPLNPQTSFANGASNGYNGSSSRPANYNGSHAGPAPTGLSIKGTASNGPSHQWPSHSPPLPIPPPGAQPFLPALPPVNIAPLPTGPARYERDPAISRHSIDSPDSNKPGISIRGRGVPGENERVPMGAVHQLPPSLPPTPARYAPPAHGLPPRPAAASTVVPTAPRAAMALPFKSKKGSLIAEASGASLISTPPSMAIAMNGAGIGGYSAPARAAQASSSRTYSRQPSPKLGIDSTQNDVFRNLDAEPATSRHAESSRRPRSPRYRDEVDGSTDQMYGSSRHTRDARDGRISSSAMQAEHSSSSHHASRRSEISVQGRARDLHSDRDRDRDYKTDRRDSERDRDERRDRHSRNDDADDRRYSRHGDDDDRRYGRHGGDDDWDIGSPRYTHSSRDHRSKYAHDSDRTSDRERYPRVGERYDRDSRDRSRYEDERHRSSRSDRHRDGRQRSRSRSRSIERIYPVDNSIRSDGKRRRYSPPNYREDRERRRDDRQDDSLRVDDWGEHRSRRPLSNEPRDEVSGPNFHDEPGAPRHPSRELASDVSMNHTPVDGVRKTAPDLQKMAVLARMNAAPTVATPFFMKSPNSLRSEAEVPGTDDAATASDAQLPDVSAQDATTQTRPQRAKRYTLFGSSSLNDYELEEKVGEGTFGVVHKARRKIGSVKKYAVDDESQIVGLPASTTATRKVRSWKKRLHSDVGGAAIVNGRLNPPQWHRSKVQEGQIVALKKIVMHNDKDGVPITALREIRILKSLDHPNVVSVVDMAYQPGMLYSDSILSLLTGRQVTSAN